MLKSSDIENLIKRGKPLPPEADMFERFYYFALDICIERYRQNKLSREEFKEYHHGFKEIYGQITFWYELLKKHRDIEKILGHAELCIDGCEKCRHVARILDGRERI